MDGQTIPETLTKPRYLNFSSFSCFEKEDILANEKFKKQLIFKGQFNCYYYLMNKTNKKCVFWILFCSLQKNINHIFRVKGPSTLCHKVSKTIINI